MALLLTLGGFAVFLVAIGAVVVLPLALTRVGRGGLTAALLGILRWPALLVVLLVGLAVLYRYGPHRSTALRNGSA